MASLNRSDGGIGVAAGPPIACHVSNSRGWSSVGGQEAHAAAGVIKPPLASPVVCLRPDIIGHEFAGAGARSSICGQKSDEMRLRSSLIIGGTWGSLRERSSLKPQAGSP
jgi:hypothetical protein